MNKTTSRENAILFAKWAFYHDKDALGTLHKNGQDAMCAWFRMVSKDPELQDSTLDFFQKHRTDMERVYDDCLAEEPNRHEHTAVSTEERPFTGCVRPYDCEGAAHGGVTLLESCSCGASRRVNVNGHHGESGPWRMPETSEDTDAEDEEASKPVCKLRIVHEHGGWTPFVVFGTGAPTRVDQAVARMEVALFIGLEWLLDKNGYLTELEFVGEGKLIRVTPSDFEMEPSTSEIPPGR